MLDAKVTKAVELPSKFSVQCWVFYSVLIFPDVPWKCVFSSYDVWVPAERCNSPFSHTPSDQGRNNLTTKVWCLEHCHTPYQSRILSTDCGLSDAHQATSSLLFHFASLFKKLGPLGAVTWVLTVDPVEAWALLRSIALASHSKQLEHTVQSWTLVIQVTCFSGASWSIKSSVQIYKAIYNALFSWSTNRNLRVK